MKFGIVILGIVTLLFEGVVGVVGFCFLSFALSSQKINFLSSLDLNPLLPCLSISGHLSRFSISLSFFGGGAAVVVVFIVL